MENSATSIKLHPVTPSSDHTFRDTHPTAPWANNSNTETLPKLWKADILYMYLYIYIFTRALFYLKTILKQEYTAGFSSRDKILWDPALFCFSHPNIHIVITEK